MTFLEFITLCKANGVTENTKLVFQDINFGGSAGPVTEDDINFWHTADEIQIKSMQFPELD